MQATKSLQIWRALSIMVRGHWGGKRHEPHALRPDGKISKSADAHTEWYD